MIKKKITYTDYLGEQRTEEFHFNLTKTELSKILMSKKGGFANAATTMMQTKDLPGMYELFETVVLGSYGQITEDGAFFKSPELSAKFKCTVPYDMICTEISESEEAFLNFLMGVIPSEQANELKKAIAEDPNALRKALVEAK